MEYKQNTRSPLQNSQISLAKCQELPGAVRRGRTLFTHTYVTPTNSPIFSVLNAVIPLNFNSKSDLTPFERRQRRIDHIMRCMEGENSPILLKDRNSDVLSFIPMLCGWPGCPHCNDKKTKQDRALMRDIISKFKRPRLMTVSFRNLKTLTHKDLLKYGVQVDHLKKMLSRPRSRAYYIGLVNKSGEPKETKKRIIQNLNIFFPKKNCSYNLGDYCSVTHIEFNKKGSPILERSNKKNILGYHKQNNWNVNIHIVYDGDYIPCVISRELFKAVTNNESYYIYFEEVQGFTQDKTKTVNYLTHYLRKRTFKDQSIPLMIEYYNAVRRIRFTRYSVKIRYRRPAQYISLKNYCLNTLLMDYWDYMNFEFEILTIQSQNNKDTLDLNQFAYYTRAKKEYESRLACRISIQNKPIQEPKDIQEWQNTMRRQ